MAASAAPRLPQLGRAVRGALTGLAVCVAWYAALEYARHDIDTYLDQHPETDGLLALGAIVVTALKIGVPLSYLAGLLVAWAVRLRRPWAVSLLGLLLSGLLICWCGVLTQGEPVPRWLSVAMIIGVYAGVALVPLDRHTRS